MLERELELLIVYNFFYALFGILIINTSVYFYINIETVEHIMVQTS